MRVFRLHRRARAVNNFDGSLAYPGRWNPPGTPMLYASTHLSLCCLEMLVHFTPRKMPPNLVWSSADLPLFVQELDFQWDIEDPSLTRQVGHRWAQSRTALAASVPSVVLPQERNVLLNPQHEDYYEIGWTKPEPLSWDHRIVKLALGK